MSVTPTAAERRELIHAYLLEHPLSSSREISNGILEDTGGVPASWTGATYIAAHRALGDLYTLEQAGRVRRYQDSDRRAISWQAIT
jgi:hypothetical protein